MGDDAKKILEAAEFLLGEKQRDFRVKRLEPVDVDDSAYKIKCEVEEGGFLAVNVTLNTIFPHTEGDTAHEPETNLLPRQDVLDVFQQLGFKRPLNDLDYNVNLPPTTRGPYADETGLVYQDTNSTTIKLPLTELDPEVWSKVLEPQAKLTKELEAALPRGAGAPFRKVHFGAFEGGAKEALRDAIVMAYKESEPRAEALQHVERAFADGVKSKDRVIDVAKLGTDATKKLLEAIERAKAQTPAAGVQGVADSAPGAPRISPAAARPVDQT